MARWLDGEGQPVGQRAELVAEQLVAQVRPYRSEVIALGTEGVLEPVEVEARLDAMRWLARIAHHLWRISLYLDELAEPSGVLDVVEPELDV